MFITLEGPDGSGKSTQLPLLVDFLRQQGLKVLATREPGGTSIGEQVRGVLHRLENKGMHPRTEILLFLAARAQHVEELIRPRLEAGELVLCDRYADSTLAYQGYGHGVNLESLRQLLDFSTGGLWPDLTLLLDIPSEAGLRRRQSSHGEWNRMDDYALEFHRRVRQGYLDLVRRDPQRWVVVDASRAVDEVQADLRRIILERLRAQPGY